MDINQIKPSELWDTLADSYAQFDESYFPARLKMRLLRKYASPASRCLDIGIANGLYSLPLASAVQSIDGIDTSQKMLEICRQASLNLRIGNLHLHQASAEDLPFENDCFDLTFSFATLVLVPAIDKALDEIVRTLKPGGIAVLDISGKNNLSGKRWQKYYHPEGDSSLSTFALPEIKRLFPSLGLRIIEIHAIGVLDQWKFIRGLWRLNFLGKITHAANADPDLDSFASNLLPAFANHYFLVLQKHTPR